MRISTHLVQGEAMLDALYTLNQYSLQPNPPFQNKDDWAAVVCERKGVTCHATFEAETHVSVAASTAMTQNVRGKMFPASGVYLIYRYKFRPYQNTPTI